MLTPKHIKARLIWARRMMPYDFSVVCYMPFSQYGISHYFPIPRVRFSDEKRFAVWSDGPIRVWRKDGDRYRQGRTKGSVKHSKAVMMHLIIASDGTSVLTKCDDRQDSASYQSMVLTPNLSWIRHRTLAARASNPIVFMQDGAPSNTSHSTQRFLSGHGVQLLPNWPPNSPDLNPVNNC